MARKKKRLERHGDMPGKWDASFKGRRIMVDSRVAVRKKDRIRTFSTNSYCLEASYISKCFSIRYPESFHLGIISWLSQRDRNYYTYEADISHWMKYLHHAIMWLLYLCAIKVILKAGFSNYVLCHASWFDLVELDNCTCNCFCDLKLNFFPIRIHLFIWVVGFF